MYSAGAIKSEMSPAISRKHIESEGTEAESGESKLIWIDLESGIYTSLPYVTKRS